MKEKPKDLPESVRACLWFSNPEELDWEQNQNHIITQILNRGTWEAVRWAREFYGIAAIEQAVRQPQRGLWFPQTLNFWQKFFGFTLHPSLASKALFSLSPTFR